MDETGQEIPGIRLAPDGHLNATLPHGEYSIAIADQHGYAYDDTVAIAASSPTFTLRRDCYHVTGDISRDSPLPTQITFLRLSKFDGERYRTSIAADHSFALCLPPGDYVARVRGNAVSLDAPVTVPARDALHVRTYRASDIERAPANLPFQPFDTAAFARQLAGRRLVGMGEANHGTAEFATKRAELSLELARHGDLRSVMLEVDAIRMFDIDDYVQGSDIPLGYAITALGFWITDTYEFIDFFNQVRDYNATVPADRKVHVLGIDAQRLEPPVQYLLARSGTFGIEQRGAELLSRIAPQRGAAYRMFSLQEQEELQMLLERIERMPTPHDLTSERARAHIAVLSIRHQLGYLVAERPIGPRDRAMAELALASLELGGPHQAAVLAHNGHIARTDEGATPSLGMHLAAQLHDDYYPIAFLSYQGTARAWDYAGKIGVVVHTLAPPPSFNVESVLNQQLAQLDIAYVSFENLAGPVARWLELPRYVRQFGAVYSPYDTQMLRSFPSDFAAVALLRIAHASSSTPSGERRAAPK